jgi:hypothetical protein
LGKVDLPEPKKKEVKEEEEKEGKKKRGMISSRSASLDELRSEVLPPKFGIEEPNYCGGLLGREDTKECENNQVLNTKQYCLPEISVSSDTSNEPDEKCIYKSSNMSEAVATQTQLQTYWNFCKYISHLVH